MRSKAGSWASLVYRTTPKKKKITNNEKPLLTYLLTYAGVVCGTTELVSHCEPWVQQDAVKDLKEMLTACAGTGSDRARGRRSMRLVRSHRWILGLRQQRPNNPTVGLVGRQARQQFFYLTTHVGGILLWSFSCLSTGCLIRGFCILTIFQIHNFFFSVYFSSIFLFGSDGNNRISQRRVFWTLLSLFGYRNSCFCCYCHLHRYY